jgi:hypothetical protein
MAAISVEGWGEEGFLVTVTEHGTETRHQVTAPRALVERVAPGKSAASVVAASFRFLLEREPKESILGTFELGVISRYFPEYEATIGGYVGADPAEPA